MGVFVFGACYFLLDSFLFVPVCWLFLYLLSDWLSMLATTTYIHKNTSLTHTSARAHTHVHECIYIHVYIYTCTYV